MKKNIFIILLFSVFFAVAQEDNYIIKNSDINSLYSDFGVVYYGDKRVVFTSSRKDKVVKKKNWIKNNQTFLDIYKGDISLEGKITNVTMLSKGFKGKFHVSNVAFTKDLKTVYFSGNNFLDKKNKKHLIQLFKAKINANEEWSDIKKMPFNSDDYHTGHPSLNEKEDKLYFISNMNIPDSYGGTDIYVVSINKDGSYGVPKNLGPNVNTSKDEMFPFISTDNVLYYSSDGFDDNYGGLDIYKVKFTKDSIYSKPKNLGKPINSRKDDHSFIIKDDKNTGFFASNRKGGKGDDDIYFFVNLAFLRDTVFEISGVVKENKSNALLPKTSVALYKKVDSVSVDDDAYYNFKNVKNGAEHKNISYLNKPKKKDLEVVYLDKIDHKTIPDTTYIDNKAITDYTVKVVRDDRMLNVNNTYFDFNSSYLTSKAKAKLNKIVNILRKNPKLNIECASHTSARGTYKYNMWLSKRRAKRVADYLISKGISRDRITSKGYGETQIFNRCLNGVRCTDLEHRENRRTEFRIAE